MKNMIDRALLASRYLLLVFFGGLMVALALYACRFVWKLVKFGMGIFATSENDALLDLLYLLDSALVASLVVMVALSSYDTLVSRLSDGAGAKKVGWIGTIDPGNLKIKLATSIVAVSSIHLLQVFMKADSYDDRTIFWGLIIHAAFLAGVIVLAVMDRLEGHVKEAGKEAEPEERL